MTAKTQQQFSSIDNLSLTDRVVENIERMIIDQKIKPGEKLPNEHDLANQLKVGRSTVREAIKRLESRNVLNIIRGSGTYVCDLPGLIEDPFGFRFIADKKKLALDLCDIRLMIEPRLAECAALNSTAKDVDELQLLCDQTTELIRKESVAFAEKDIEFHTKIAQCSGNQVVHKLIPFIHQGISLYSQVTVPALTARAPITHQLVVDAIRARNSKDAKDAMEEHLHDNLEILKNVELGD